MSEPEQPTALGSHRCEVCGYDLPPDLAVTCPECGSGPCQRAAHLRRARRRLVLTQMVVLTVLVALAVLLTIASLVHYSD